MGPIQLSEAQQQTLQSQVFDDLNPGPILHDFQVLLDFVGPEGVKATGKYHLLPLAAIPKLDEKLSQPLRLPLKHPQWRSHPYLQGLHLLLRASGLTRVDGTDDKARLVVDAEALDAWHELNATEQYFTLLEAWLVYGQGEMIGEESRSSSCYLPSCLEAWSRLWNRDDGLIRGPRAILSYLEMERSFFHFALMDLFGLVEISQQQPSQVPWSPTHVFPTPFGKALFDLFGDPRRTDDLLDELLSEKEEEEVEPGSHETEEDEEEGSFIIYDRLQPLFAPYFPQWQNNLLIPVPGFREGTFVFQVSLKDMWRRIAISAESTLDDLVPAILESINFDSDHLYQFSYRDRFGVTVRIAVPMVEADRSTDEVQIGELPLPIGGVMTFLYDFGDEWPFTVKLERIDPPKPGETLPRVLARRGKAPKQYPDVDWD